MLKGTDLIGLPIIASDSGQTLATTQDFIISPEADRLIGLLIKKGGWTGQAQVVPWGEIVVAELTAIIVRSDASIVDADDVPDIQSVLESNKRLRGTRMCTTDGVDLGVIVDLFFSRKTGMTEGYEVCGRLLDAASSHCVFVSASYYPIIEGRPPGFRLPWQISYGSRSRIRDSFAWGKTTTPASGAPLRTCAIRPGQHGGDGARSPAAVGRSHR